MIGTKLFKPLQPNKINVLDYVETTERGEEIKHFKTVTNEAPNTYKKYFELSEWCRANQATIKNQKDFYECVALSPLPDPTAEEKAQSIRSERDRLIDETTWIVERHHEQTERVMLCNEENTTLTDEQYRELLGYRQALRDVPEQPTFPDSVVWPEKPSFIK